MAKITVTHEGQDFTFRVKTAPDHDAAPPWVDDDGHGPVTRWVMRGPMGGERLLSVGADGNCFRYYDWDEALVIAERDGWDAKPYNEGQQSKREQAEKAVKADFEYLQRWCREEWHYVSVTVTLLDPDGRPTIISQTYHGVEFAEGTSRYVDEAAQEIIGEILAGYGTDWGPKTRTTYEYLTVTNVE